MNIMQETGTNQGKKSREWDAARGKDDRIFCCPASGVWHSETKAILRPKIESDNLGGGKKKKPSELGRF